MLAQLTGTHSLPGCLPATPLELDNAPAHGLTPHPRVFMDIYRYFSLGDIYIYISQKKLYVQQLAFIRVSLALTETGMCWWGGTKQRRGQSRAATSTRAVIKYFRMGNAMFVTKMIQY